MKKNNIIVPHIMLILMSIFSCEDPNYPDSIWDADDPGNLTPLVTEVAPVNMTEYDPQADSLVSYAGVGIISITGKNFSPSPSNNIVFFDGIQGDVLNATETQLTIRTPDYVADSITIKVSTISAYLFANDIYPYQLVPVFEIYGGFIDDDNISAIAVDSSENLYVTSNKNVYKVEPDSSKKEFATLLSVAASVMKSGPGGFIYYAQAFAMFRLPLAGGIDSWNVIFPRSLIIQDMDFDANGNLYCAGSDSNIYRVDIDTKTQYIVGSVSDSMSYTSLRIYNDMVYVAGTYNGSDSTAVQEGIWRFPILSGGDLGTPELVLDWGYYTGASGARILSLNFSEDGYMYIGSDKGDAITIRYPDGSLDPLYEQVLDPPIYKMIWGNKDYLYVSYGEMATRRILRINMGKEGAPYWGRP